MAAVPETECPVASSVHRLSSAFHQSVLCVSGTGSWNRPVLSPYLAPASWLCTVLCAQSQQPWSLPTGTELHPKPGPVRGGGVLSVVCQDPPVGTVVGCTSLPKSSPIITMVTAPDPLQPPAAIDLLGLRELRLSKQEGCLKAPLAITVSWPLPACRLKLGLYFSLLPKSWGHDFWTTRRPL